MYQVVIVDDEPFVLEDLKKSIDWEGSNFEIAYADTDPQRVLSYIHSFDHGHQYAGNERTYPDHRSQSHPAAFVGSGFVCL